MVMSLAPAVCRSKWNLTNASCGHRFSQALAGRGSARPLFNSLNAPGMPIRSHFSIFRRHRLQCALENQ